MRFKNMLHCGMAVFLAVLIAAGSFPLVVYADDSNISDSSDGQILDVSLIPTINITKNGNYHIIQSIPKTDQTGSITIAENVTTKILLDNITLRSPTYITNNIVVSDMSPLKLSGGSNVTLVLKGSNIFHDTGSFLHGHAGIEVPIDVSLDITSVDGNGSSKGSLTAICNDALSSGIGSSILVGNDAGNITIDGGTIVAKGGTGIGGYNCNNWNFTRCGNLTSFTMNGGNLTATGKGGPAIGGGSSYNTDVEYGSNLKPGNGGTIKFNGGIVHATTTSNDGNFDIGEGHDAYHAFTAFNSTGTTNVIVTGGQIHLGQSSNISGERAIISASFHQSGGSIISHNTSGTNDIYVNNFFNTKGIDRTSCFVVSGGTIVANGLKSNADVVPITICGGTVLSKSGINGTFTTKTSNSELGNATIFSSGISDISYKNRDSGTQGIIFDNCTLDKDGNITGGTGQVYGAPTIGTNFTIPVGCTLNNPATGKIVNIAKGVTSTIKGTLNNNGTIYNYGTIVNDGKINNLQNEDGTVGRIINKDGGVVQSDLTLHLNNPDDLSTDVLTGTYTATSGQKYGPALPVDLTRSGWVLVGWNTKADGSGVSVTADTVFDGNNTELYAQWAQVGKISAKVTDSDNRQPISGSVVVARNSTGQEAARGTTGSDGTALLPNMKPGTYSVEVVTPATGYAASASQAGIAVKIGKTSNVTFTARPFKGSIAITHLDTKRNKLIAIAPVKITDKNGKTVYTGSSANPSLTVPNVRVPDGPFTLVETAPLTNYRTDVTAYTVSLVTDGEIANVEMHSVPTMGDITYTATDKDGKPIVGATVNLVDKDGKVVSTGTTDSSGKVTFKDVYTGDYTVQLPGYENGDIAVTVKDQQNTAPAPVKAAMLIGSMQITHVDAQTGKELPVSKVQLKDKTGKVVFTGAPADNGTTLEIPSLTGPASPYTLTEVSPIANFHANTTQYTAAITVQGQVVKIVMQSSQYAGDVILHITDPTTGKPAADVTINLIDKGGNIAATGKTDKNGNVTFTNIPIGDYTYTIADSWYKLDNDKAKSITVTDGGRQTVSVPVIAYGNVTLHITDPSTGNSASGVTVNLIDKDGKVITTGKTDKNGNVTFTDLPAGEYTYKVTDPNYQNVIGEVTIGTGDAAGTIDIEVKHPASSSTVSTTGSANITATDNIGKPLANVPIIIKDSSGKIVGTGTTDSNGSIIVSGLPDGTYTVSSGDSSVILDGSITITNGQTANVTLKGSRLLTGNAKLLVVNTQNQPMKNFTLLVMRVTSFTADNSAFSLHRAGAVTSSSVSANGQVVAEVTTDASGYVTLPQLPSGKYILVAKDSAEYKVDSPISIVPSTTISETVTAMAVKDSTPPNPSSSSNPSASSAPSDKVSNQISQSKVSGSTDKTANGSTQKKTAVGAQSYTAPKTGQNAALPFLVIVLLVGCCTVAVLLGCKRKN